MDGHKGILLGVPGHSYILINVADSGHSVQKFVDSELSPSVLDKKAPLDEVVNNSGILIKFDGSVELIGNLVTTAGGTYLRFDRLRQCFVLHDGVRYSGQRRYDNVYSVQLNKAKIRELAKILEGEGLDSVRFPPNLPAKYMPRMEEARQELGSFVRRHCS